MYVKAVGMENFDQGIRLIFDLLQRPRLNKQLSYMLLDAIIVELFPELSEADILQVERLSSHKDDGVSGGRSIGSI